MKDLAKQPEPSQAGKATESPRAARGRKRSTRRRINAPAGRGAANLRSSVNTMVARESDRIALALIGKTIAGNMTGARILVQLTGAQNPPPEKKKKRPGPSWSELLSSEPDWDESENKDLAGGSAKAALEGVVIKPKVTQLQLNKPYEEGDDWIDGRWQRPPEPAPPEA